MLKEILVLKSGATGLHSDFYVVLYWSTCTAMCLLTNERRLFHQHPQVQHVQRTM